MKNNSAFAFYHFKNRKKIIIQTKNKNDPALLAVKSENLLAFCARRIEKIENLGYPPYKRFIKITYLGDKEDSIEAKKVLREVLKNIILKFLADL